MDRWLKIGGAVLLLLSATLPMATCSHYEDSQGKYVDVGEQQPPPDGVREVVKTLYAFEEFDPFEFAHWLKVLVFLWPVATLVVLHFRSEGAAAMAVRGLELVLVGCTIYWLCLATAFYERLATGTYVASLGVGAYAIGAVWGDCSLYQSRRLRTRA